MGKESGTHVLIKIGADPALAADADSFADLMGQRTGELTMNGQPIDVSDKTTGGWAAVLAGTLEMTIECTGVAVWPESVETQTLRQQFLARKTVNAALQLNEAGDAWLGRFSITNFSFTGNYDGATEYSVTLQAAEAPSFAAGRFAVP